MGAASGPRRAGGLRAPGRGGCRGRAPCSTRTPRSPAMVSTSPALTGWLAAADLLAIDPDAAGQDQLLGKRARLHQPGEPQPLVDALALLAGHRRSVALLASLEPRLQRGQGGEGRVGIGRLLDPLGPTLGLRRGAVAALPAIGPVRPRPADPNGRAGAACPICPCGGWAGAAAAVRRPPAVRLRGLRWRWLLPQRARFAGHGVRACAGAGGRPGAPAARPPDLDESGLGRGFRRGVSNGGFHRGRSFAVGRSR